MTHNSPSLGGMLSSQEQIRFLENLSVFPNIDNLLNTLVAAGDFLAGEVEPQVYRFTQTIGAMSSVTVTQPITEGYVGIPYGDAQWDCSLTSPSLTATVFGDSKLWTPRGYPITKATGTYAIRGYDGAKRVISIVVVNGTANAAQLSLEFPAIVMSDTFYQRVWRPLINGAVQSLLTLSRMWGGSN